MYCQKEILLQDMFKGNLFATVDVLLKGDLFTFTFKTLYPRGAINWGQLWLMQWPVA